MIQNSNDTLEKLKMYLQDKYDILPINVNGQTSLLYDLKIKGDDIDEFFSKLIKDFSIDVKRLDLSRFFVGEEPFDFISPIIRLLKGVSTKEKPTILINDIKRFIDTEVIE